MHQKLPLSRTLLLAFCIVISCKDKQKDTGKTAEQVKDYPVLTLTPRSITLNSEYPATIEGQQDIEIRPKIDGFIEKIYVDEGSTVKSGQAIFKINAPQYEQEVRTAQANIKIAEADVNSAQMGVNKVQPLVEKNIISKYELESAQFNLQAKQAALAQAHATLANARTNLSYTIIASPADGIIGLIPYKIGSLVNSNTPEPLTTVSNIGNIYAYFSINEKQVLAFSKNTKGNTTKARLATMPPVSLKLANGIEFSEKGRITTTSGSINTETGSIRVRATFPNPGSIIRSGSSALIRIPSRLDSAIVIPQKATYEIQGKKFVYRVAADGTVKSAEVGVADNNDGLYFIAQTGLAAGDKIVLEGVASLREGAKIIPKSVKADSVYAKNL